MYIYIYIYLYYIYTLQSCATTPLSRSCLLSVSCGFASKFVAFTDSVNLIGDAAAVRATLCLEECIPFPTGIVFDIDWESLQFQLYEEDLEDSGRLMGDAAERNVAFTDSGRLTGDAAERDVAFTDSVSLTGDAARMVHSQTLDA